ncbi:hypothetical protein MJO28_013573 [Puccinia striiformis f. sp. tritici]|uniref:Uncharacterized protein n=1 Tax=Puccinia striiformis f. sp. tritici TaxID=168172 RepID=A0ACC0DUY3_9BASI|nr:hypothetical protein MJO28_013573 [Puccinia striiformis f. sp. tritici]
MTSIKFLSVLMVIILQGQVVHSRRRSRDSTDKGTSPTNQSSQCLNRLEPLMGYYLTVIDFPPSAAAPSSDTMYVVSSLLIIGFLKMQYKHMYCKLTPIYQQDEKSKPAGMKSAPITGGSISGSCSEPVF